LYECSLVWLLKTIIAKGRATIETNATLKGLKDSEFRARLEIGDRGRRDNLRIRWCTRNTWYSASRTRHGFISFAQAGEQPALRFPSGEERGRCDRSTAEAFAEQADLFSRGFGH
jgi:hypothetical protein